MNDNHPLKAHIGEEPTSGIGLTSDAPPEDLIPQSQKDAQTGVSTRDVLSGSDPASAAIGKWYALRSTYGREKKAYDYLVSNGVEAFYPTVTTVKLVGGKRKTVIQSRIPNIFFAYGTEDEIKRHVYDNVNLPYLRFYYRHIHTGSRIVKEPLVVPARQIESLKIICAAEDQDIILVPSEVRKFHQGQTVRIITGPFAGVIGKVARYRGQQRVAVIIDGMHTLATAYIPTQFMHPID